MNPASIIITYMDWSKWKTWWFNIPLFLFQLTFMVVGTAIGKIRLDATYSTRTTKIASGIGIILILLEILITVIASHWTVFLWIICLLFFIAAYRGGNWVFMAMAAQASHVRLCLRKMPIGWFNHGGALGNITYMPSGTWRYINFGYPKAKLDYWRLEQCKGRFEYRDPTFTFSQERIDNMIQYAYDQVDKKYDWLQLLSPPANFPIWIIYWPWWGKEIIRWFNLPGAREYCSSGAVATLLWFTESRQAGKNIRITDGNKSEFFGTYDPAMVMPCMFVISEQWRLE